MYCSNCGLQASGNFCSGCGAKLGPAGKEVAMQNSSPRPWREEIDYETLLQTPEVRNLVARHAAQARSGLTGEQFVELCDKAFSPLIGVPLSVVTGLALPLYDRLGIRTTKSRMEVVSRPPGEMLVAALCSLAWHGQKIKYVQQAEKGCTLTAELPSDLRSMTGGELRIVLLRQETSVRVEAATKIPGQLYDWGKSTQVLAQLFDDLANLPYVEADLVREVA